MKVRVLIKTVISGHWLSVGDVYEGTEEELRLYFDSGFVEPIGNPKVSEDSELSTEPEQLVASPKPVKPEKAKEEGKK